MPGKWINNEQVKIYMKSRNSDNSQVTSAAKAGISERSGRDIENGKRKDPKLALRKWRTRQDPLAGMWEDELLPMLEKEPNLQPITLLEYMQNKNPDNFPDSLLRTLQRRGKTWRALNGPDKEVMFNQCHKPGLQGLSDFTTLKRINITIAKRQFDHLLYHFRLAFSHWSYMKAIEGGESFTALSEGLQNALQRLGGSPQEHRTDSLSAAFKNLSDNDKKDLTTRYESFCQHYSMKATRNNKGKCHENGAIESAHGHLKRRIEQALLLRSSNDFETIEKYQDFIDNVVQQHNQRNAKAIKIERQSLQSLPGNKTVDYSEIVATVSRASTINVRRVIYTVPSRLCGETMRIRLYDNKLFCYLGCEFVIELKRIYPKNSNGRAHKVDYRHIISSLVKKPQAFRYSRLKDMIIPNDEYRLIWQHLDRTLDSKKSCKLIVKILHLAYKGDCEKALSQFILSEIEKKKQFTIEHLQSKFLIPASTAVPDVAVNQHDLSVYDALIPSKIEVSYA